MTPRIVISVFLALFTMSIGPTSALAITLDTLGLRVGDVLRAPGIEEGKRIGLYFYTNRSTCSICDKSIDRLAQVLADSGIAVDYRKFISGADESMVGYYKANAPHAKIIPDEISAYRTAVTSFAEPFWVLITPDKKVVAFAIGSLSYDEALLHKKIVTALSQRNASNERNIPPALVDIDLSDYAGGAVSRRQFISCDGKIVTIILNKPGIIVTYDVQRKHTTYTRIDTCIGDHLFGLLGSSQLGCSDTIMLLCNTWTNYRKIALLNIRTLRIDTVHYRDRNTVFDTTNFSSRMLFVPASKTIVTNLVRLDTSIVLKQDSPTLVSFAVDSTSSVHSSLGASGGYLQHKWSGLPASAFFLPSHHSDTIVEWMSNSREVRILATSPTLSVVRSIPLPKLGAEYRQYEEDFPFRGTSEAIQRAYSLRSMAEDVYLRGDTLGITWMNVTYGARNDEQMPYTIDYGVNFTTVGDPSPRTLSNTIFSNSESVTLLTDRAGYLVSTLDKSRLKVYLYDRNVYLE